MRQRDKSDLLMAAIIFIAALIPSIILFIGSKDREEHQEQRQDTILVTLEDSVHYFEDGM